jgi:UDP-4-amino-4,6-dideoxy-N-acetyl-beta-L-altrosamine transaminase
MEKLAIKGGKPIRESTLSYGHQFIDEDDIITVVETLRGDWLTQGPKVDEFEKKVAEYCGAKYAVAVTSGTAALHAACAVAGISKGDEAIVTPLTFAATANAVVYCGGRPVFADIDENTLNLDPAQIIKQITSQTKALLPVDFAGHPVELDMINEIAKDRGLIVIEDACHALGAEYKGKKIGGFSDMTIFSFHPVKHITTGEGGMILTNNEGYYQKLKVFRHHGIVKDNPEKGAWHYNIYTLGYNFRITDFQCALGISQMKKLDSFLARRREIAVKYDYAFADMPEIIIPKVDKGVKHAYHIYVIQLRLEMLKAGRKEIFDALRKENIGVNVHYMPLHLHPFYQKQFGYKPGDFPKAEQYYNCAITLPLFPAMRDSDINDVIQAIQKVIGYYKK